MTFNFYRIHLIPPMCVRACSCHGVHVDVREDTLGVSLFFLEIEQRLETLVVNVLSHFTCPEDDLPKIIKYLKVKNTDFEVIEM